MSLVKADCLARAQYLIEKSEEELMCIYVWIHIHIN